MSNFTFPSNPTFAETYSFNGRSWQWTGFAWQRVPAQVTANSVYAGPASGSNAAPTFRALVGADLPIFTQGLQGAVPAPGAGGLRFLNDSAAWTQLAAGSGITLTPSAGTLTVQAAVPSVNGLTGALSIVAGANVTVTPSGSSITIASSGGGGGGLEVYGLSNRTPVPTTGWTWLNQGTNSAATVYTDCLELIAPPDGATTTNVRCYEQTLLSVTFTVTAFISAQANTENFQAAGLTIRDSSTGRIQQFVMDYRGGASTVNLTSYRFSNETTFVSTSFSTGSYFFGPIPKGALWMRIARSGTTLTFSISQDGRNFIVVATDSSNYVASPDRVGLTVQCNKVSGSSLSATCLSWSVV